MTSLAWERLNGNLEQPQRLVPMKCCAREQEGLLPGPSLSPSRAAFLPQLQTARSPQEHLDPAPPTVPDPEPLLLLDTWPVVESEKKQQNQLLELIIKPICLQLFCLQNVQRWVLHIFTENYQQPQSFKT